MRNDKLGHMLDEISARLWTKARAARDEKYPSKKKSYTCGHGSVVEIYDEMQRELGRKLIALLEEE